MNEVTPFKVVTATVASVFSWIVGGIGISLTVLIGLMAVDYITGLMVGYSTKELSSSVGKKGLTRKVYILLLISALYLIQLIPKLKVASYTGDGVAVMYAILELVSIVENGGKLGVWMPKKLKDAISVLKAY